jgi:hypothetical protein
VSDWLTPEDVAAYLSVDAADPNVLDSTAAVKAAVEHRHGPDNPWFVDATSCPRDIHAGSVQWAGLMFQSRNAPSGYAGYGDDASTMLDTMGSRRSELFKLLRWRHPVVS